jgi:hypothetical protein
LLITCVLINALMARHTDPQTQVRICPPFPPKDDVGLKRNSKGNHEVKPRYTLQRAATSPFRGIDQHQRV